MLHYREDGAHHRPARPDDDVWTYCGELVDAAEVTTTRAEADCISCLALLLDDDDGPAPGF